MEGSGIVSNGAKVALAVGAGYLLGRTRKMRIAMMLAAAGVTGKFPARSAELLGQGLKTLGATDQLRDLTDQLRGEVLTAAKAAAVAAATNRVDALNDRLQGVVPTEEVGRTAGSAVSGLTSGVTGRGRRRRDDEYDEDSYDDEPLDVDEEDLEDEDADDEDSYDDEPLDVDEDDLEDEADEDVDDEQDEDADFDDEPEPVRRRASRKASAPRASTRRRSAAGDGQASKAPTRRGRAATTTTRAPVRRGR